MKKKKIERRKIEDANVGDMQWWGDTFRIDAANNKKKFVIELSVFEASWLARELRRCIQERTEFMIREDNENRERAGLTKTVAPK